VALGRLVVLASSKTLDEMLALARLCARPPILIFENGAGIAWPASSAGRAVTAGGPAVAYRSDLTGDGYAELRSRLRSLRRRGGYRFLGFGDLSAREVARHTGLSLDGARLARHRAASEPLLWLDTVERLEAFRTEVNSASYRLVEGGRFLHVMPPTDKATAMGRVAARLTAVYSARVRIVACGDSGNDRAMLEAADHAVVFPRRDGSYLEIRNGDGLDVAVRVAAPGAACWSRALERLPPSRAAATEDSP
jgi:mannosyl-3-phosphoglycerate phosphatase